VKFIIMQFSPRSFFLHFRSKYPSQHSVLKNHQSMFLLQSERPSFAPIQYNWRNYILVIHFIAYIKPFFVWGGGCLKKLMKFDLSIMLICAVLCRCGLKIISPAIL
jgi:hypothetical protein